MATIMNYEVLDLFVPNCIYEGSKIRAMALSREQKEGDACNIKDRLQDGKGSFEIQK